MQALPDSPPDAEIVAGSVERFPRARHVEEVRRLSQIRPWRSVGLITLQWGVVVAAMTCALYFPYWWVYLIAGVVIATRQQAIGVLVHDGAHWLLFKNHTVNDIVCDLFLGFPSNLSTTLYRSTHFQHHRYVNTEEDCDLAAQRDDHEWFDWPKTRSELWWTMLRSITGLNAYRAWPLVKQWAPWMHMTDPITPAFPLRARVLYVANIVAVYTAIALGFRYAPGNTLVVVLLYIIPTMTLLNLFNRLRATSEHVGLADEQDELGATRSVAPSWWERLTVCPVGVNYHLEHHLFPSVPGPNLARLHRHLMQDDDYRRRAHVTRGYAGAVNELMASPEPTSRGLRA
ncbi:Fatty acid desaturase [Pirellulimonas nuda]|uniref:Fatty acid desaturase n=1 Tax=Pirellulimonas nuda TaxID=2528009 RepID=A0A518DEX9_9BACT|nr:fatty acid desaturase family protein [Pirellulimonas nuda]QDU90027.1 Fatty acid desaturase [Pirellulimonas nuda]